MPTINFPSGPSLNDTYNLGLRTWKWNGDAWALQPLTGGFTGSQGAIGYTGSAGSSTGIDDNATSTAITIDSSENVGIGTLSPAEKLDVTGNVKITGALTLSSGVSNSTSIVIKDSSGNVLKTMYGTTS
jgi:hypothetical protein